MMHVPRPTISGGAFTVMGRLSSGKQCTVELRPCQANCAVKGLRSKTQTCTLVLDDGKGREITKVKKNEECTMPCPTLN